MFESQDSQRRIGRFAWVMAWVGLVVGQLHALSRHATVDGREDLELPLTAAWSEPASDLLSPLLTWADPNVVYVTYGKIWFPVFLAFTLCAFVVRRRRQPVGAEKWAWRVFLVGAVIGCIGVFLEYWTQWTGTIDGQGLEARIFEYSFFFALAGLPLMVLGATALGIILLRKRVRPLLAPVLLAATIPLAVVIAQVTSMGNLLLPVMFAFGILGRHLALTLRPGESADPAKGERHHATRLGRDQLSAQG